MLLLAACSSGEDPAASLVTDPTASAAATQLTSTAEATSTATPTAAPGQSTTLPPFVPPTDPDATRAFEHLRALAVDVGSRPAGTAEERAAAAYIRSEFEAAGYLVEIETFEVDLPRDDSELRLPGGDTIRVFAMTGAAADGEVTAPVVIGGLGRASDLEGVDATGAILLLDRGQLTFGDKARNALAAGAVAVVIANNQPGPFRGALGAELDIPVVAIASEDAPALDALAGTSEPLTVATRLTDDPFDSQNVVGRPSETPCTAYLGAHYDSVPAGPGANDNASGAAALLELARTHRVPGLCVVAFGAEEVGLVGSRAYVDAHDVGEVRFVLNLDMVAKRTDPRFIATTGDPVSRELADRASAIAAAAGFELPRGSFPSFASSDHASFSAVGIPAITIHSGDDDFIHSPRDGIENVNVEDLEFMLGAASAVLRELLADER